MTTHLANQEHSGRHAPAAEEQPGGLGRLGLAIDLSIKRRPALGAQEICEEAGELCEEHAAWPYRLRRILRASLNHWRLPSMVETAELLLTELVTNAFLHADAPTVGVRVYRQGDLLMIEVNDGTPQAPLPRPAGFLSEHGRGMLIVDALAKSWGVSEDHMTTWCSLSLPQDLSKTDPAPAAAAPVQRETELHLPCNPAALGLASIQGRTQLALLGWPGNQHAAVQVLYALVRNALAYGITPGQPGQFLTAALRVTEADELLIDVTDPNPTFPDFDKAIVGELGQGLWEAQRLGATIDWFLSAAPGKTVRAVMQPEQAEL
ncbi:ATP-binding protein [Streptomyces hydrogenans]|uniref:ATP-binding protein n=1 Tax=Streptomyces hydrogenans TaxID=1873719 RepID=UPI003D74D69F